MKNLTLLIFILTCNLAFAQTNWVQKTDFGGTARWSAIGASIGTKGYIGMGRDNNGRQNDLWEWNQATNSWMQKANFPALGRAGAIGFAIGSKLYVGTGYDGNTYKNDLYEFDPTTNTWTQKANIPVGRAEGVGFSIGTKGYMLTGSTSSNIGGDNDLWEYDQTTNVWTQKANVPTTGTFLASGFSIGTKGYLLVNQTNFWEYDPVTDTWTQKANIGVSYNINRAADFSANGKGYLAGIGQNSDELWEYTPTTNTWIHLENISNGERGIATGFSIGNLLYVGTGYGSPYKKDYWEGNPSDLCTYPTISAQPIIQTANLFENSTFSVLASGIGVNYQWQTDNGSGFQNISNTGQYSGANTNYLNISNILTNNDNQRFRCKVFSGYCSINSDSVSLNVTCIPLVAIQPNNQSASLGNNVSISVQSSYSNINYQWQTNFGTGFQNISNAGQFNGANNDTLTVSSVTTTNNNQLFRCLVSLGTCIDTTSNVSLSVGVNSISEHESKKSICSIFPNPTNESINIKVLSDLVGTTYLIIDQLGKEILVGKLINETTTLDISFLSSGLYFIRLKDRNDFSFKISKQ
jgi:hypothetical protein